MENIRIHRTSQNERRRALRIPYEFVIAFFKGKKTSGNPMADEVYVNCHDLSETGISFISEDIFRNGEVLNLEIPVPQSANPIVVSAYVIRSAKLDQNNYETALKFTDINAKDHKEVVALIDYYSKNY